MTAPSLPQGAGGRVLARFLVPLLLAACGCARLPALTPVTDVAAADAEAICGRPFPLQPWRAVHTLQVSGPLGYESALLGVTLVDPPARRIRAVIVSLEGLVLFDATGRNGTVEVHRALPPLDRKGFPEGLMHDVQLLFLSPEGSPSVFGVDDQDRVVCRWEDEADGTTDLTTDEVGSWELLEYGPDRRLRRTAQMTPGMQGPLAAEIRLTGHGLLKYTLDLTPVEAQFLQGNLDALFTVPADG